MLFGVSARLPGLEISHSLARFGAMNLFPAELWVKAAPILQETVSTTKTTTRQPSANRPAIDAHIPGLFMMTSRYVFVLLYMHRFVVHHHIRVCYSCSGLQLKSHLRDRYQPTRTSVPGG